MDRLIPYLKEAKALTGCRLQVFFEDGVNGIIDLNSWTQKPVFKFWKQEEKFSSFKITANEKIEWNEEIDMDPDAFYLKLVNKAFDEYASDKQLLRHSH